MNESIFGDVLQQFSERFAESENFSEIRGGKIGAGARGIGAFAADLNHTDHFVARKNRRADNFLNCFAGIDAARFHTFKNGRVTRCGKTVVDFGAAFADGAGGERRIARQWNETDVSQRLRKKKIKVSPLLGEAEDADFFRLDVEITSDALGDGSPRDRWRFGAGVRVAKSVGESFKFRYEAQSIVSLWFVSRDGTMGKVPAGLLIKRE
jgi:hypothetical protein